MSSAQHFLSKNAPPYQFPPAPSTVPSARSAPSAHFSQPRNSSCTPRPPSVRQDPIAEGSFREDLFYRLNVITVQMPPLRERPRDVLRFAEHYLRHCAERCGRNIFGFTSAAEEVIRRYSWPGNLRELHNTIERAVILTRSERLDAVDLPVELRSREAMVTGPGSDAEIRVGSMVSLDRLEEQHIRRVIENCANLNDAASVLGIDQATLYRKRKKMGLKATASSPEEPAAVPTAVPPPATPSLNSSAAATTKCSPPPPSRMRAPWLPPVISSS